MPGAAGYSEVNFDGPVEYVVTTMKNGVLVHVSINTSTGHTKAKMAVRSGSERFAAVRIFAFFLGMAGFLALRGVALAAAPEGETAKPYHIVDGRVDKRTYNGFRRYHAGCNHCHGPDGVGSSFGPSLIEAPMTIEQFRAAVLMGRATGSSVMKGFADDPNVAPFVDDIYAYLRARSDGAIGRGRPLQADER
jgi:mono/diheme cytochrome c family protein